MDQLKAFIEEAFADPEAMPTMLKRVIESIPSLSTGLQKCGRGNIGISEIISVLTLFLITKK